MSSHGLAAEFQLLAAAKDEEEAIRFFTTQPPQSPVGRLYSIMSTSIKWLFIVRNGAKFVQ